MLNKTKKGIRMSPVQETPQYLESAMTAAKVRVAQVATRYGLSAAEREDMEQELLLELVKRRNRFDPSKGAAGTFTGMVTKNRVGELVHDLITDRMLFGGAPLAEAANDPQALDCIEDLVDQATCEGAQDLDLFTDCMALHDLHVAISHMDGDQSALFDLLCKHADLPAACGASGMSSATFYRRVADIQMHLRMFGIRAAA
jgi:hypothetical protein